LGGFRRARPGEGTETGEHRLRLFDETPHELPRRHQLLDPAGALPGRIALPVGIDDAGAEIVIPAPEVEGTIADDLPSWAGNA